MFFCTLNLIGGAVRRRDRTEIRGCRVLSVLLSFINDDYVNQWLEEKARSNWRALHRLIHIVVLFSLLHYIWLTKDGFGVIFFMSYVLECYRLRGLFELFGRLAKSSCFNRVTKLV
ncbi:MAG: hypothetical protein Ct9H90mP27_3140 [Gammaproteobacteria bacterium]|nr:MAG: hypothetical protein Ct9H90mP27_3140 [Gammaproteobacteria bacterium]